MKDEKKLFLALNEIKKGFGFIASRTVPCGTEHAFRLPMNVTVYDVRKRIDALVSAVGCPVEIKDRGGAVQVLVVHKDFPATIPFDPEDVREQGILMGYNRHGDPVYHPLNTHLLVGGASNSGKTVWMRSAAYQLARQGYFVFISDLKGISFFPFEPVPNINVVDNLPAANKMLDMIVNEIDKRKTIVKQLRNRDAIKSFQPVAFIGDEGAVFSPSQHTGKMKQTAYECEDKIAYIGQQAREFKVFSILAYQRPDEKTINKQYKANIEATLCFRTQDEYNSRIIMGREGAERISPTARGRCIYTYDREHILQVPYVSSDAEWEKLLAPFKLEVLESGRSRRTETPRQYINGTFSRADRDEQTAFDAERFAESAHARVKGLAGTAAGSISAGAVPWPAKVLGAHQEREAAYTVPSAEIQ